MDQASGLSDTGMILRAKQSVEVYLEPIERKGGWSRVLASAPPVVARVESGYRFRILDSKDDCYLVELYSGKIGYVLKDLLVEKYELGDTHPLGSQVIRSLGLQSQQAFFVDRIYTQGIPVRAEPKVNAKELFVLGPSQGVAILDKLEWYYKVALPGSMEGYVVRNHGTRHEWAAPQKSHLGFYGVRRDSTFQSVQIRLVPDCHAESIGEIDRHFRLPVVEEWDAWFRVQLPNGSLGFVPEAEGDRTIDAQTLVEKPKEGGGSTVGGLLGLAGLLTLSMIGAAVKDAAKDIDA